LRPRDGQALPLAASSRTTAGFLRLVPEIETANPDGDRHLIADKLASQRSGAVREWLAAHPRVQLEPFPTGACWLNLIADAPIT
jgi:transposase